jgi:hypothetical protein
VDQDKGSRRSQGQRLVAPEELTRDLNQPTGANGRLIPHGAVQLAQLNGRPLFSKWYRQWELDTRAAIGRDFTRLIRAMNRR